MNNIVTPSSAIKKLWQEDFFSGLRKLSDVRQTLKDQGLNFSDPALLMALKAAKFLVRKGTKGQYIFVQKFPPPKNSGKTIVKEIIYGKGAAYDFYKDIKFILNDAKTEVLIVDPYVNQELLDLYLENLPIKVRIKILTNPNTPKGNFYTIARKFALKPKVKFEVRETNDCHDRAIFVDQAAWVFGQSLKDAGKKPTYLIFVNKANELRKVFEALWNLAIKTI